MKILHISHSDSQGGAARAAYRIHRALIDFGIDSRMWVDSSQTGDWTVSKPSTNIDRAKQLVRKLFARLILNFFESSNPIIHSPSIMSSNWAKYINESDADVVNLHWVQGEMLSICDIAKINKPIVWTLHDMWAFSGAEHYTEDNLWRDGYSRKNRPSEQSGFDLNRWTWKRKLKHWNKPFNIVSPSRWLDNCVKQSQIMKGWPSRVIPNPIDGERWKPVNQKEARLLLGLSESVPIMLFGAVGGSEDPRKGFDLLKMALENLNRNPSFVGLNVELLILGETKPRSETVFGFKVHYLGHLFDEMSLRVAYSAADLVVVPSRQDNLPNVCLESLACGTPLVAFDIGGFSDVITHKKNGYLAKAFDADDLSDGIMWVFQNEGKNALNLRDAARSKALSEYSTQKISDEYVKVYLDAIRQNSN